MTLAAPKPLPAEAREEKEVSRLDRLIHVHAEPIGDLAFMDARVEREGLLLKGQRDYLRVCEEEGLVMAEKSRRVGLTWAQAGDDVLIAATNPPFGRDVNYVGTSKEMAREYIDAAADWARAYNKSFDDIEEYIFSDKAAPGSNEEDRHIQVFRISFASGNKIEALSARPRSFRGRSGRAVLDEFAFQDQPAELVKAAGAFLIRGGDLRIISTHNGVDSVYNDYIKEIRNGTRDGKVFRYDFEDAVADGLYEQMCWMRREEPSRTGKIAWLKQIFGVYKDNVEEELFCVPTRSGGSFMSRALIERQTRADIPVVRFSQPDEFTFYSKKRRVDETKEWCETVLAPLLATLNPRERHAFGSDFARSSDLSVIWPLAVQSNLVRRTPFVVEMSNIPFEQQEQILFFICHRLPRFFKGAMDATGNGAALAEAAQQKFGSSLVEAVNFSVGWYREETPKFKSNFEDEMILVPADDDTVSDIHMFKIIDGVARMPSKRKADSTGQGRHGDSGIACLLADYASRQDSVEIEHEAGPTRKAGDEPDMIVNEDVGFGIVTRGTDMGGFYV